MKCQKCKSEKIVEIIGVCQNRITATLMNRDYEFDYVPGGLGIGGGRCINIEYCLYCGQIQGEFPILPTCFKNI